MSQSTVYQPSPEVVTLSACLTAAVRNEVTWTRRYDYEGGFFQAGFVAKGDGYAIFHFIDGSHPTPTVEEYTAERFADYISYITDGDRYDNMLVQLGSMFDEWKAIRASAT